VLVGRRAAKLGDERMTRWLLVLEVVVLMAAAVSCGGGAKEATPTAEEPSPLARPTLAPIEGTPTITDNRYEFPALGYSVSFPQGWTARPSALRTSTRNIDVFFAPAEEGAAVQPNIAVTCESPLEGTPLDGYVEEKRQIVTQVSGKEPVTERRKVSGLDAVVLVYTPGKNPPLLDKTEALFLTDRCIWSIAITVPQGERANYQALFDEFLASFQLSP
jgi:hypothetical protein